jgi:hypothetical protein
MTTPQQSEHSWWWKVAKHLDDAQIALGALAITNADDPAVILLLQEKLREAQATLFAVFQAKGLVPTPMPTPPTVEAPPAPEAQEPSQPSHEPSQEVAATAPPQEEPSTEHGEANGALPEAATIIAAQEVSDEVVVSKAEA